MSKVVLRVPVFLVLEVDENISTAVLTKACRDYLFPILENTSLWPVFDKEEVDKIVKALGVERVETSLTSSKELITRAFGKTYPKT